MVDMSVVEVQPDWIDVDAEHINDPHQCGVYAYDIFEYYKTREVGTLGFLSFHKN